MKAGPAAGPASILHSAKDRFKPCRLLGSQVNAMVRGFDLSLSFGILLSCLARCIKARPRELKRLEKELQAPMLLQQSHMHVVWERQGGVVRRGGRVRND